MSRYVVVAVALLWACMVGAIPELTVDLGGGARMEFVWIEPGTFTMGSPDTEQGRKLDEGYRHQVTISKGFYLGKREVTQAQWEAVMGNKPWFGQGYVQAGANHPAVCISWGDVQTMVDRLNRAAGEPLYRMPTEAEWEYACRAGTSTPWSTGDSDSQLVEYAWCVANAGNIAEATAQPVGTKKPNPWGLHDMHGNVWEWCQDWYAAYSALAQTDPSGPATGVDRVRRGGGFGAGPQEMRSAFRGSGNPGDRCSVIGARLVRNGPARTTVIPPR